MNALLEVICRYSGLTTREYAEMVRRPVPSVRRDLMKLRRRGALVSHQDPELSKECGSAARSLYWHDVKCDIFVDFDYKRVLNVPHGSDDRGWLTHRVVATLRKTKYDVGKVVGDEVGHITISYIPRAVFDERYPDVEAYARGIQGIAKPLADDLRRLKRDYEKFRAFHVASAHVAYVEVECGWRLRLIATSLYHKAARWMGETEGLVLAASDTQTPEAKAVWDRLERFGLEGSGHVVELPDGRRGLSYLREGEYGHHSSGS